MGQFDFAIKKLGTGNEVKIKPRGNSMRGIIESGDSVILAPLTNDGLPIGSVVLVKVRGNIYLHLIKAIRNINGKIQYQIGNNRGGINGWANRDSIYGIVKSINGNDI